jgi:orotate phosphoribosyltransferase
MIAGVATAGIAHAAFVSDRLKLPMCYVRSGAKSHGTRGRIEGRVERGQKVVIIEDLISTGGSSMEAAEALKEAGTKIEGVAAIFSYGFDKAKLAFSEAGISCFTLSTYDYLLEEAVKRNYLVKKQLSVLQEWRIDPENWMRK